MKLIFKGVADLRGLFFADKEQEPIWFSLGNEGDVIGFTPITSAPEAPPAEVLTPPPDAPPTPPPILKIKIGDPEAAKPRLRAEVQLNVDVPAKAYRFVEQLLQSKYLHYGPNRPELPIVVNNIERVTANGRVVIPKRVPFLTYPEPVQAICIETARQIESIMQRFIGLMCWRLGLEPSPSVFDDISLYWGLEKTLTMVSEHRGLDFFSKRLNIHFLDGVPNELAAMWLNSKAEPLGHELVREAISLSSTSPRSALLIAVSAVEAGVKAHIASVVPDAKWLLESLQSPPIPVMLSEYVERLHKSRGTDMAFWNEFSAARTDIKDLITIRNTLAHTGVFPKLKKNLRLYIRSISDILYALDVLAGHEWAKERVHISIKKKLQWPGYDKQHMELGNFIVVSD